MMFTGNLKGIRKEATAVIKYLGERNIEVSDMQTKLDKLNYLLVNKGNVSFVTKSGINYSIDFNGGGYYTPIYTGKESIDDYVILIEKQYLECLEYKVHEFLHFVSTKDLVKGKIKSGIVNYNSNKDYGLEAINEGITDFFTFRICGKAFDSKYFKLYTDFPEESPYYYPVLLINLLVYGSGYNKDRLLKAYIENDDKYIFKELKKRFGLNKEESKKLFADAINFYYNPKDKALKKSLQKDIKKVVNFYYNHLNKDMQSKYKNFEKIYLGKFKSLYK